MWGPCVALLARHWAPRYMARANSFMLSTFAAGWIVASLAGRLVLSVDWRIIFMLGGTSIIAAGLSLFLLPPDKARAPKAAGAVAPDRRIGLRDIFAPRHRKFVLLATLQNACQMGGFWAASSWIPTFLVRERCLALEQMATFSLIMYSRTLHGRLHRPDLRPAGRHRHKPGHLRHRLAGAPVPSGNPQAQGGLRPGAERGHPLSALARAGRRDPARNRKEAPV